jgi:hypothetical protein
MEKFNNKVQHLFDIFYSSLNLYKDFHSQLDNRMSDT